MYHGGVCVFDMWGGYADLEAQRPWSKDTITMTFSSTKGLAAIVLASLAQKLVYLVKAYIYWNLNTYKFVTVNRSRTLNRNYACLVNDDKKITAKQQFTII